MSDLFGSEPPPDNRGPGARSPETSFGAPSDTPRPNTPRPDTPHHGAPPYDAPPPDAPPQSAGRYGRPAFRRGATKADGVVRMENVRITAPDLARRAALEKSRSRLVVAAGGFTLLFAAVVTKLAFATIIMPMEPHRLAKEVTQIVAEAPRTPIETALPGQRATITDRNGQPMAISLNTVALYADPRQVGDPEQVAAQLKKVLPRIDLNDTINRLKSDKKFVYIAREISPREELEINDLGIPGVDFEPTQHREYPLGRTAAQVLGGVDIDEHGFAGVERYFDKRLSTDNQPLRLSIDLQVQAAVREELQKAMDEFTAIGGCGIVMDVNTGEVLAMVSLPDYDANDVRTAPADERFNRAVEGTYEPGSTFKLQTASMALDTGAIHIWDEFDASRAIRIGRFTITDFEGKHRWLYLPEVLAYSSNLGAAHIALAVGAERQRAWLKNMGMFGRTGIQLPESALPIIQPASAWKEVVTMTVGFGHGIAVTPLHVVRGTAAVANGGILLRPTILALNPGDQPEGRRVMQESTSMIMRKLMRLVVTDGFGKAAEVAGYYPGGKTGTAEKVRAHGGYRKHTNVSAFMSVFPMNNPRYAVYMMLDEPHGTKATYGFSTAGWVAAPAAGKVIARIGPMLGLLPDTVDAKEINASLYIPLEPARPPGAFQRGPGNPGPFPGNDPTSNAPSREMSSNRPNLTVPATELPTAISRSPEALRHETRRTERPKENGVKDGRVEARTVRVKATAVADR
ncbi:MAG TPA: penicillin-binding protein 2 [Rhodopila sp.]|uniref:peptidoglycan D,D-transpeptidase FtsI family protein n=1 Tax=Rhodopila sp. TaxID=2480087 RepID=UPI002D110DAE|nr:penicillin-binding protein 2 [Rhodopila sp.]HVY15854.1 penicillin-binding protein 2 [Rhodopila sp.]